MILLRVKQWNFISRIMMNNSYVYFYTREDGTPYYVGKGVGNRARDSSSHTIKPKKDLSNIFIVAEELSDNDAISLEKYFIGIWGRKDLSTGILRNKTDGGEGCCGIIWSQEVIEKRRQSMIGKCHSAESKEKMSDSKKGKTFTEAHKQKLREARLGKKLEPRSEETKKKIAESVRNNYASKKEKS
jgi:hypothetical protein